MALDPEPRLANIRAATSPPERTPLAPAVSPQVRAVSPKMMMMAHDASPPPGALADETIETVRAALIQYLDGPDRGSEDLRDALNRMASEAREKAILPEQLLIILKDIWYSLPKLKGAPDHQRTLLLQRVVTICIREYYSD